MAGSTSRCVVEIAMVLSRPPIAVQLIATCLPVCLGGCALADAFGTDDAEPSDDATPGHFTYMHAGTQYLAEARDGSLPVDVSAALDELGGAQGQHQGLNISPNGEWLVFGTSLFDEECDGWPCLALSDSRLRQVEVVLNEALPLREFAEEGLAIASSGDTIVYIAGGDSAGQLMVISRGEPLWSKSRSITTASPFAFHNHPALSADGKRVLFDCGDTMYGGSGTSICEVGVDGSGFRNLFPDLDPEHAAHHPDYGEDGEIVFEADFGDGSYVWRLGPGDESPERFNARYGGDGYPCVLPDGRVVSILRYQEDDQHAVKVMFPNGTLDYQFALDIDEDQGSQTRGCGE